MRHRDGSPNGIKRQPDWPFDPRPAPVASDEDVETELRGWELAVLLDLPDAVSVFLECLWRLLWPSTVERLKRRYRMSWDDAEDAVSGVFSDLAAGFRRGAFPHVYGTWASFIEGASANKWRMARRKQHGTVNESALEDRNGHAVELAEEKTSSPLDALPDSNPSPVERLFVAERDEAVQKAVEALPPMQQAVTKATMSGLSHAETASQLGISPKASGVHRCEAGKELKQHLGVYKDEFGRPLKKRA